MLVKPRKKRKKKNELEEILCASHRGNWANKSEAAERDMCGIRTENPRSQRQGKPQEEKHCPVLVMHKVVGLLPAKASVSIAKGRQLNANKYKNRQ